MDIIEKLRAELGIRREQVEATIKLIDEGNTIPFIARYRKEVTGSLNDEVLRNLSERLIYLRNLEEKKEQVLGSIEEQGKLTEELRAAILAAETMVVVEDLYRPYRPKRRTRATIAKEKGLEPLAELIWQQETKTPLLEAAAAYVSAEKEVADAQEALQGAMDILAERVSDEAEYRIQIRALTSEVGSIRSEAKDDKAETVYEMYYHFEEKLDKLAGHRVLALNRGEAEKVLSVKIIAPEDRIITWLENQIVKKGNPVTEDTIKAVIRDSYDRLIAPAIERELRNELTEKAEDGAIHVFGRNLGQLLMQPPISGQVVLGWDPGIRTGCKLAVVDATGKVLDTAVIYPVASSKARVDEAKRIVKRLIEKYNITLISVGNGTASRESEQVIVELLKELDRPVQYVIVSEAGASVYSASKLATEEFPDFDVAQRSAASIARRLQDPLAELVKIEPKAIGVGQYQHDMNQKKLSDALTGVVEDCVNRVGVDLNTASAALLEYISGISKPIAKNIVAYREENGKFRTRQQLLKVPKLGPKAFEQCAGFLRIADGTNPLDATSVHPESYAAAEKLLESLGFAVSDIKKLQAETKSAQAQARKAAKEAEQAAEARERREGRRKEKTVQARNANTAMGQLLMKAMGAGIPAEEKADERRKTSGGRKTADGKGEAVSAEKAGLSHLGSLIRDRKKLAAELGIGEITLSDIIKELEKPGRDPRDEMPKPILRTDVLEMKDLAEGMVLKGTVRNVIDFGAFVDIGVHQDGLVHISQMAKNRFVKHPLDVVSVGDIVEVKVMSVDLQKKRIQLTMIL
ncbi:MAG: RNA-binding transcriptional accessory protein [Lachnospiraceae bacterium]|nr:RNA-binding transcriptional accessory protein [Lachnospiraceae bacterium]